MANERLMAKRFVPPPLDSTWAYRHSDGRMEHFTRLENAAWGSIGTVRYRREMGEEPVEVRGYNKLHGTWMVTHDAEDIAIRAADPDDRRYRWPLHTGVFWKTRYELRDLKTDKRRFATASWRVDGFERVAVPWGSAVTVRLISDRGRWQTKVWYAWELGVRSRVQKFRDGEMTGEKILVEYSPA